MDLLLVKSIYSKHIFSQGKKAFHLVAYNCICYLFFTFACSRLVTGPRILPRPYNTQLPNQCRMNIRCLHEESLRQLSQGVDPDLHSLLSKASPKCSSRLFLRHSVCSDHIKYLVNQAFISSRVNILIIKNNHNLLTSSIFNLFDLRVYYEFTHLQLTVLLHLFSLLHRQLKGFAFASLATT